MNYLYFPLRPAFPKHRSLAILAAVLFRPITSGLGCGRTLEKFLTTGLLYGLPMAFVFARRDWEHAAGTHYMLYDSLGNGLPRNLMRSFRIWVTN